MKPRYLMKGYRNYNYMKTFLDVAIEGEKEAIRLYTFHIPFISNGNDRRSIQHILREEQEHLKILQKMKEKL